MSVVAVESLALGLIGLMLGWATCGVFSIIAAGCGHRALKEIRTGERRGRGIAVAGLILGYVTLVPSIVLSLWVCAGFSHR